MFFRQHPNINEENFIDGFFKSLQITSHVQSVQLASKTPNSRRKLFGSKSEYIFNERNALYPSISSHSTGKLRRMLRTNVMQQPPPPAPENTRGVDRGVQS